MRFSTLTISAVLILNLATSALASTRSPREAGPLVFRSRGTVHAGGKDRPRDRTITLLRKGNLVAVKIDDHVDNKVIRGTLDVTADRQLVTEDPQMMNAANLIAITPRVLAELKRGVESVETEGAVEANGKVYPVVMSHALIGRGGETSEVVTVTESENGKLHFETRATVDSHGIPLRATTTGHVKVFVFNADINLTLERVSGSSL